MLQLDINGATHQVEVAADTPLLWVLRDHLNLTGTKFGCGVAACGACTVQVDGAAMRSCVVPASAVVGKKVRTIEALGADGLSPLQQAWVRHQVPQCGYCQSGMLMAATALLAKNPAPSDADIDREITNICRCGTYQRIRAAIKDAAAGVALPSPRPSPLGERGVGTSGVARPSPRPSPLGERVVRTSGVASPSPRPSPLGERVKTAAFAGGLE